MNNRAHKSNNPTIRSVSGLCQTHEFRMILNREQQPHLKPISTKFLETVCILEQFQIKLEFLGAFLTQKKEHYFGAFQMSE